MNRFLNVFNTLNITYIIIFIFIVLSMIHLFNMKDNETESFITLTEDQNISPNIKINVPSTDLVQFSALGTSTAPNNLSTIINKLSTNISGNTTNINTLLSTINNLSSNINVLTSTVTNLQAKQDASVNNYVPDLTIVSYTGSIIPPGWQLCEGGVLKFSNSQTAVTTSYKNITNFTNLRLSGTNYLTPDLRGRFVIGTGSGTGLTARNINAIGGTETHTLSMAEMPRHNHGDDIVGGHGALQANIGNHPYTGGTTPHGGYYHLSAPSRHQHSQEGGNGAHNNMPPFYVLTYIIKQPENK